MSRARCPTCHLLHGRDFPHPHDRIPAGRGRECGYFNELCEAVGPVPLTDNELRHLAWLCSFDNDVRTTFAALFRKLRGEEP